MKQEEEEEEEEEGTTGGEIVSNQGRIHRFITEGLVRRGKLVKPLITNLG